MKHALTFAACTLFAALLGSVACAQDSDKYVSKEEYMKLKTEHDRFKQELDAIKAQLRQAPPAAAITNAPVDNLKTRVEQLEKKQEQQQTETDQSLDQMDKNLKNLAGKTKAAIPGTSKLLLAGYGSASFQSSSRGYGPSQAPEDTALNGSRPPQNTFAGSLNALFLYEMSPKILFEGELELETDTLTRKIEPNLEQAQVHYLMNDNLTLAAGAFLDPMDYFIERQHMAWVNKLPDKPLAVYDGLLPETQLGAQLRGGVPVGPTKLEFAVFTAMAPKLVLDPGNPGSLGTLDFDDFAVSSRLAGGAHVGWYLFPQLEIGYGFQAFKANAVDAADLSLGSAATAFLQSADLSFVKDFDCIKGTLNFHAQWVWSHLGDFTTIVNNLNTQDGSSFSPFRNNRDGGYAQLAYRPTKLENAILKNLEVVFRYDRINQSDSPLGMNEERYTEGLDYWLTPSVVIKLAYEMDRQHGVADNSFGNFAENGHSFWMQIAVGF